jgi:hypothetical protein
VVVSSETPRHSFDDLVPVFGHSRREPLQQILDDVLFVAARGRVHPVAAVLQFVAFVDQQRGVAAIVHNQLRTLAACVAERLVGAPPVVFERLALPRKNRNAGGGDGGGGVVLRRKDVATRPAHRRAQVRQRLDQHRGLDGHVQRAGDAHARQRLLGRVFAPDGHQARHFLLGDGDLLAAPFGQREVGDLGNRF